MKKRFFALSLAILMIVAFAVPVTAADNVKKLHGDNWEPFFVEEWNGIIYLGGIDETTVGASIVKLQVAPPNNFDTITYMQVEFTSGDIYTWDGVSKSFNSGNNQAFVLVYPFSWGKPEIIDNSYLIGSVNNFVVSGFIEGNDDPPVEPNATLGLDIYGNFIKTYCEENHTPVYKKYGTLVSFGNFKETQTPAPAGVTGDYFLNNGMTYFKINKAALIDAGSATIDIAESNKPGNKLNTQWNTPIPEGKSYTLSIVDGKLVIDSEIDGFGAAVYALKDTKGKDVTPKGPADIKHNGVTEYDLPAGDDFYFFFHIGSWTSDSIIVDCTYDGCTAYSDPVEEADVGYEVAVYLLDDFGNRVGESVYNGGFDTTSWRSPDYDATGTYEYSYVVILSVDGEEVASEVVTFTVIVTEDENGDLVYDSINSVLNHVVEFVDVVVEDLGCTTVNCVFCNVHKHP